MVFQHFSANTSSSQNPPGILDPSKAFAKMIIICLWTPLGPIKVVMLTTLEQKLVLLMVFFRKNPLFNDLMMKIYDFDAL